MIDKADFFNLIIFVLSITFIFGLWINKDLFNRIEVIKRTKIKTYLIFFVLCYVILMVIATLYSFFPEKYYLVIPLPYFDQLIINAIGQGALKFTLIWFVGISTELILIKKGILLLQDGINLATYFERIFIKRLTYGILITFIGFFFSITSITSFILMISSLILFFKMNNDLIPKGRWVRRILGLKE